MSSRPNATTHPDSQPTTAATTAGRVGVGRRLSTLGAPSVDSSKPATDRHFKTGHHGVAAETNGVLLRGLLGAQVGLDLGAPAPRSAFENVGVMEQPIEERGDG